MKKVLFIYNPGSGERKIINKLDTVIKVHQSHGYHIVPYRLESDYNGKDKGLNIFFQAKASYEYIIIAGGDGTVDTIVNYLLHKKINIPIGILPTGTANDFASFIDMPKKIDLACLRIIENPPVPVDVGKINNKYFINVASTGLFTSISQKTDSDLKNTIGKIAYYVKGLEELPKFKKIHINLNSPDYQYNGDIYLALIFNGRYAGSIDFGYKSKLQDGLLDVIIFRSSIITDVIDVLFKMFRKEHLEKNSKGIIYFKTNKLRIECTEDIPTDIDGEPGPDFPLNISSVKNKLFLRGINKKLINN